jgi:hypothetical protein
MGSDPVSFEATKWVMENSPYTGGTFTVHLVMAHIANEPHDWQIWMSQENLAEKARVSERTVRPALQQMIEDGYLEKVRRSDSLCPDYGRGGRRPTTYRLLLDFPEASSGNEADFPEASSDNEADFPEASSGNEADDGENYRKSARTYRQSASDLPAISVGLTGNQRDPLLLPKKEKERERKGKRIADAPQTADAPAARAPQSPHAPFIDVDLAAPDTDQKSPMPEGFREALDDSMQRPKKPGA